MKQIKTLYRPRCFDKSSSRRNSSSKPSLSAVFALLLFLLAIAASSDAQIIDFRGSMVPPIAGVGHHYLGLSADIVHETVNPANGSLSVRFDMPTPQSRGLSLPFSVIYNSSGIHQLDSLGWSVNSGPLYGTGWTFSLPSMTSKLDTRTTITTYGSASSTPTAYTCEFVDNFVFQDYSGQKHSFNVALIPATDDCVKNSLSGPGGTTSDYSGSKIISQEVTPASGTSPLPADVFSPDGTRYHFSMQNVAVLSPRGRFSYPDLIEDRNGNVVSILRNGDAVQYTDTVGRTAVAISAINSSTAIQTISVASFHKPYQLQWSTAPVTFTDTGGQQTFTQSACGNQNRAYDQTSLSTINSITMPDDLNYQFEYDPVSGLLNKIIYPSGAYIKYTWGINPLSELLSYKYYVAFTTQTGSDYVCSLRYGLPAIIKREVSYDGVNVAQKQEFAYATTWGNGEAWTEKTTTVTTTDLVLSTGARDTVYVYGGVGVAVNYQSQGSFNQAPVEKSVIAKDEHGVVLSTLAENWTNQFQKHCSLSILNDGKISGSWFTYDNYYQLIETDEYDFGVIPSRSVCDSGGPPPLNPTRVYSTTYAEFTDKYLHSFPAVETIVYNGSLAKEVDYEYDR